MILKEVEARLSQISGENCASSPDLEKTLSSEIAQTIKVITEIDSLVPKPDKDFNKTGYPFSFLKQRFQGEKENCLDIWYNMLRFFRSESLTDSPLLRQEMLSYVQQQLI